MPYKYLYKTLAKGLRSVHGDHSWTVGKWYKVDGPPRLCYRGFHASNRILDAWGFVRPGYIALVEVRGEFQAGTDKEAWAEMRIVKKWRWYKKDSVKLAIFAAGLVICEVEARRPHDDRPRAALDAARRYLKHPTERNKDLAQTAAGEVNTSLLGPRCWGAISVAAAARCAAANQSDATFSSRIACVAASYASLFSGGVSDKCEEFIKKIKGIKKESVS